MKQFKRVALLFAIWAALCFQAARANVVVYPTKLGFNCEKDATEFLPYDCRLEPDSVFLGVRVGMDSHLAFLALEKNAQHSVWVSFDFKVVPRTSSPKKSGIDPDDWPVFGNADKWLLRDTGAPCLGYNYISVEISKGRVESLDVHCDELIPAMIGGI